MSGFRDKTFYLNFCSLRSELLWLRSILTGTSGLSIWCARPSSATFVSYGPGS